MGHEIDSTNGVHSFADSRSDAWHQLGQQVGHLMTAEEVLREAHLANWNVRKVPLVATVTEGEQTSSIEVPDRFITVRDNPVVPGQIDALGVVGRNYEPYQPEETAEFLNALTDESGAHFETAGALRGGRETFVTMKLPQSLELRGNGGVVDRTDYYLASLNSYDGSSSLRALVTPIRVVCKNTQDAAISSAASSFSMRHTSGMRRSVMEARETLGLTFRYIEAFELRMQGLVLREMTDAQVDEKFLELVGLDDATTDIGRKARETTAARISEVYRTSDTVASFRGTAFGAWNAVTEYSDHMMRTGRRGDVDNQRARRTLNGALNPSGTIKTRALTLLSR